MMLIFISLLACALAMKASENAYSNVVCSYLEMKGITGACNRELTNPKTTFCPDSKSLFTEDDLKLYTKGFEVNFDEMKADIEASKKQATEMFGEMKKMCAGFKECEKMFDALIEMIEIPMDLSYDAALVSYSMANTFNLGAVCLAANPEGRFETDLPVVTKSIIDRMVYYCESTIDMSISYLYKMADALGKMDPLFKSMMKDGIKEIEKLIKGDANMCEEMANAIPFVAGNGLFETIGGVLEGIAGDMENFDAFIQCVMTNITNPESCVALIEPEAFIATTSGRLALFADTFSASASTMVVKDSGFDVYGAAKESPLYDPYTKVLPPTFKGGSGLAGWAIALIVIAAVIVVVGVILAVFFLVIKPKKAGKGKSKGKDSVN